ncbi:hypothetical protein FB451DRAFT_1461479 [Mycena latifolia]|nr:hypothetical protein FB451DRAFT_1461479 [Mycena latifolia]
MLTALRPVHGQSRQNSAASHAHSTTRHEQHRLPRAVFPGCKKPFLKLERTGLERWYMAAWRWRSMTAGHYVRRESLASEWPAPRQLAEQYGPDAAAQIIACTSASDATRGETHSLTRIESAESTRHGLPTRRATVRPRKPRAQERPASPRGGVRVWLAALMLVSPRSPGVPWPRRLVTPSGGGIRAVCGRASEEPRMHDSAGYAARASRAEAACPGTVTAAAQGARPVRAHQARPPTPLRHGSRLHAEPCSARLPIPLLTKALAHLSVHVVPYSLLTTREPI